MKRGKDNPNYRGGMADMQCAYCGSVFRANPRLKKKPKYCTITCASLGRCRDKYEDPFTRFTKFVIRNDSGCWEWTGAVQPNGYGRFDGGYSHRFSFESFRYSIPHGLQVDHLCRNRRCVNPFHLQPVTAQVNQLRGNSVSGINARKTHCIRGHEFTDDNT